MQVIPVTINPSSGRGTTMFLKKIFAFVISLVVICESAFVDSLRKCSKDDGECQKKLITDMIQLLAEHGDSELGLPAVDPLKIDNDKFSILDIDITLDGVIKGVKKCVITKFTPNVDKGIAKLELTCDVVVVKGKYKVLSRSQFLKTLMGGDVHGDGNGKVKITKLTINLEIPFDLVKKGDDIFLSGIKEKVKCTFDIKGIVHFAADNLYLGETESSAVIIKLLNENSDIIIQTFGKFIVDIAVKYVFDFTNKIFNVVPTKHYFIEDMSPYVKS